MFQNDCDTKVVKHPLEILAAAADAVGCFPEELRVQFEREDSTLLRPIFAKPQNFTTPPRWPARATAPLPFENLPEGDYFRGNCDRDAAWL